MRIKRPAGSRAETPAALMSRLRANWPGLVADYLAGRDDFPLEVAIARPALDGAALAMSRATIAPWLEAWSRAAELTRIGVVIRTEAVNRRGFVPIEVPDSVEFASLDALAQTLGSGASSEIEEARLRLDELAALAPRLRGMARPWREIVGLPPEEWAGFLEFLRVRLSRRAEFIDIRELAIVGLDTKWLERRSGLVREALSLLGLLQPGATIREQAGFRTENRQSLWIKAHVADLQGPLGSQQFAVRPDAIAGFPASVRRCLIVENLATFFSCDPKPGSFVLFGGGNAIPAMAQEMPFLQGMEVFYWGDLDSFGLKILSRLRRALPSVTSILMDEGTLEAHRAFWVKEAEDQRFTGPIDYLTAEEERALILLRSSDWRLEQERVRMSAEVQERIGVVLTTAGGPDRGPHEIADQLT